MRWTLGLVCGVFMSGAFAQNDAGESPTISKVEVDRLAAMAPAERRAELKAMDPADRRGLWFAVMAQSRAKKGIERPTMGGYRASAPGDVASVDRDDAGAVPKGGNPPQSGLIQYDSGPFTTSFGSGNIVGNRFDTVAGRSMQNGTVTAVQAVVVPGGAQTTSSAGFVLLGPQNTAGGAMAVFSTFTVASGATDTVDFTGINATFNDSFYVLFGDFSNSYVPAFGPGTTLGQGRHGVIGYTGGTGPNITSTFDLNGDLNSFIRASATILPVELL